MQQEVRALGRAGAALPHAHGREEVQLPHLREALHAERPPDEARPPPRQLPPGHAAAARRGLADRLAQRLQPLGCQQPHHQPGQLALSARPSARPRPDRASPPSVIGKLSELEKSTAKHFSSPQVSIFNKKKKICFFKKKNIYTRPTNCTIELSTKLRFSGVETPPFLRDGRGPRGQ